jgi:acyl-CoA synthetase (AMP-forming)/AMP-acid ligase II
VLAIWLPNGPELLCLILACLKAGVVPMPLHHGLKRREMERVLEHARVRDVLSSREEYEDLRRTGGDVARAPEGPDATRLVLHTSGSNGRPKGVRLSASNLEHILQYRLAHTALTSESLSVVASCLTQSVGLYQSLALLAAGGTIVLLESYDVDQMVDAIHRHRPTHLIMVVEAFDRLLHHPAITPASLASLVFAAVGADRVTARVQERFVALTGRALRSTYGLTESSWVLVNGGERADKRLALGRPCPGIDVRLLDTDGREVAPGAVGEVHVRSPRTMLGYLHDEELTRATLEGGWLATGDLAYRDADGWYWFAGRTKHLIVLPSGDNVSPVEVEDVLRGHPGVAGCTVVGVETPSGEAPWAFVVRRDDALTEATTLGFLRERLSDYKLPHRIVFLRELPLGLTGKIQGTAALRIVDE